MAKKLYNVAEAAGRIGMSQKWVWAQIARRAIPVVRLGRSVRIADEAINEMIEQGTTPAMTDSARHSGASANHGRRVPS